jgi:hypothetical protein
MHDTDRAAAALAEIRERYEYLGPLYQNPHFMLDAVVQDVPRLVAAVEAALKHHPLEDRGPGLDPVCGCRRLLHCPERAAITTALTGEEVGDEQ